MSVVIGWDIGGAHLKAARARHGRVEAVVQAATPLWLGLDSLKVALDALSAQLGRADRHVITMTGELCDAFPSRREGVAGLAEIAANHLTPATPSLYAGRDGFVDRPGEGLRAPKQLPSTVNTWCPGGTTSARDVAHSQTQMSRTEEQGATSSERVRRNHGGPALASSLVPPYGVRPR